MKAIRLNYIILTLLLPCLLMANEIKGKYKKEKTIHKAYIVNSNCMLDINNQYGNMFVTTWDKNTTEIDVTIKVGGDDERQVTTRFNSIDVAFSATKALVSAVTRIGNMSCNSNITMEINYTVKIPKMSPVKLFSQYGSIRTGKIYGKANIKCEYGDIIMEELNADNNLLKMDYCGIVRANYIKSGNIDASYSQFNCERANALQLKAQYTGVNIEDIKDINYKIEYGHVHLGNVYKLTGKGEYSSMKMKNVSQLLNLTASYGDIKVDNFEKSTRNIAINSEYTNISLGIDDDFAFDFEIITEYAGVDGRNGFKYTYKSEKDFTNHYKGYYRQSGVNKLYIKSDYGHINFNRR